MIAINHAVTNETINFGQQSQLRLLITNKTTVTYIFVVEFLVVRVPTSSPTATDTHNSSKHIGEDRANATLLHVVSFLQASELSQALHAGPGAQPPGSATAMLQTGLLRPMLPTCLYAAPMRRNLVLQLWLPPLDTLMWGAGCIISFRSFDSWINTLEYYIGFRPREARSVPVAPRLSVFVTTFWQALRRSKNKLSQCC